MSRLDDLIDLIQTTNEVYFITAPGRVRTAYILVDDIVELTLKTFLQERALEQRENCRAALETANLVTSHNHHSSLRRYFEGEIDLAQLSNDLGRGAAGIPTIQTQIAAFPLVQHWSANSPDARNTFDSIVNEVKPFFSTPAGASPHPAIALLDEAYNRHKTRNKFYHDHQQTGLTIDDEKCLKALCGMFDLMEQLFPDFRAKVQASNTVRCQIGVLRLKRTAIGGQTELVRPYDEALDQLKRDHRYDVERRSVEHSLVHTVSDRFFRALREQFANTIAEVQARVNKINGMARQTADHRTELADKQRLIAILQQQLNEINVLLGIP